MTGPSLGERLRRAPRLLWVEAALLVATPLVVGLVWAGYPASDVRAFAGVGGGVLLGAGLLLRWRVAWAFALLVDVALVLAATRILGDQGASGALLLARGLIGVLLLVLPSTGRHLFGRAPYGSWFDEAHSA